jgi:hypothetical protein
LKTKSFAAALVAALTLAGVAAAAPRHHHPHHARGPLAAAAAAYLGLDQATLTADLKAGQSLAQVATSKGKTVDGLVAALIAPAKLKLDAAVAAGRLTADREAKILARLQAATTKLVNATPKAKKPHQRHVRVAVGAILRPVLSYLGLDFKSLAAQLRSGKSLADVAVAQGKTSVGLVDAVVSSVKTRLDARVQAGKLSAADETTFLANLQANVTALVNG